MAGKDKPETDNAPSEPQLEAQIDWHRRAGPVFKYALTIGILLIATSLVSRKLGLATAPQLAMLMATGLGIVLGAFGSLATIRLPLKSVTVVGVAAIALAIFLYINEDNVLRIRVQGNVDQYQMTLYGDAQYHGAGSQNKRHHEFVIFGHDLRTDVLELSVVARSSTTEEYPFTCIDSELVRPHLASGRILNWQFLMDPPRIVETIKDRREIATLRCGNSDLAKGPEEPAFALNQLWPIAGAQAQSTSHVVGSGNGQVQRLLSDLESANPQTRRDARKSLARAGEAALPVLIDQLEADAPSYRARLGALVAVTEMQRTERVDAATLQSAISDDAITALTTLATGPDATTRILASEIMFKAADERIVRSATDALPSDNDNGNYNLLLVIREGTKTSPLLTQADLDALAQLASPAKPKISRLVADIVEQNQTRHPNM